jgi:hypothetical protein
VSGPLNILTLNLVFSTLIFWVAAQIYLLPRLGQLSTRTVLVPILLLHSFRHLGMMFLAPGATYPGIAPEFAGPAAYGDFLAALLAMAALAALAKESRAARPLLWIFNLEGSLDLLHAIYLATAYRAAPFMGAAYWIPAFWVPALLVTHVIVFMVLLRTRHRSARQISTDARTATR